jgi:putative SOS response-associated peptidase YedK
VSDFTLNITQALISALLNLYSIATTKLPSSNLVNGYAGNLPPMPGVFPDYPAPVVRNAGAERELAMMRWGMPPPPKGHQHPQHRVTALARLVERTDSEAS